jgi:HlyD family secretion protein
VVKTEDLTEIDVVELVEGDPVVVKLDAIPDVDLRGTILSISPAFHERQGDVVYEVTIFLADTLTTLRWGMTASVSFVNED